jgi:hypothetical protein
MKRNPDRFPADFAFQLTWSEAEEIARRKAGSGPDGSRSQSVILKQGANPKYRPFVFTEQGVSMLSSVLRSARAIRVNVEIMRAFVRMRQMIGLVSDLAARLEDMEDRYDEQFRVVFDAIRQLMDPPPGPEKRRIGFQPPPKTLPAARGTGENRSIRRQDPAVPGRCTPATTGRSDLHFPGVCNARRRRTFSSSTRSSASPLPSSTWSWS